MTRTRARTRAMLPTCFALVAVALLAPATAGAARYGSRPLKPGMRGHDVSVLQKFLTKLGLPTTRDAYYGTGTRHNVKLLEKRQGWDRDGKVSRKQAKQIKRLVATAPRHAGDGTRFYFYGPAAPAITVTADGPGTVRVDAVDSSGGVVTSLTAELGAGAGTGGVGVGTTYSATVAWYGRRSDGTLAPDGTYGLSLGDGGGTGARITGGQTTAFELRGHIFPVRGAHDYGGAGSRFGAPRPGHIHQGQDVAAACGTPLLAAQGGTVLVRSYQAGGAGNYVVIRGKGTRKDYVYMHMVAPGPLVEGQPVRTGQSIGEVGNTGSSSGCHLHFERWTKPGWFAGGHAFDPLPSLQYWDSYS